MEQYNQQASDYIFRENNAVVRIFLVFVVEGFFPLVFGLGWNGIEGLSCKHVMYCGSDIGWFCDANMFFLA